MQDQKWIIKKWLLTLGVRNHEFTKALTVFIGHVYLLVISMFSHFCYCVLWVFLSQTCLNLGRRCPTDNVNSFLSRLANNALVSHSCCKSHYGAFPWFPDSIWASYPTNCSHAAYLGWKKKKKKLSHSWCCFPSDPFFAVGIIRVAWGHMLKPNIVICQQGEVGHCSTSWWKKTQECLE